MKQENESNERLKPGAATSGAQAQGAGSTQVNDSSGTQAVAASNAQAFAYDIITSIRRSWQRFELFATGLFALSIALPLMVFLFVSFGLSPWWMLPATAAIYMIIYVVFSRKNINEVDAARLLNNQHATL